MQARQGPPRGVALLIGENQVGLGPALPCSTSFDQDSAGVGLIFRQVPQIPFRFLRAGEGVIIRRVRVGGAFVALGREVGETGQLASPQKILHILHCDIPRCVQSGVGAGG